MTFKGHSRSQAMVLFTGKIYHFLLVICSNNMSILQHFQDTASKQCTTKCIIATNVVCGCDLILYYTSALQQRVSNHPDQTLLTRTQLNTTDLYKFQSATMCCIISTIYLDNGQQIHILHFFNTLVTADPVRISAFAYNVLQSKMSTQNDDYV